MYHAQIAQDKEIQWLFQCGYWAGAKIIHCITTAFIIHKMRGILSVRLRKRKEVIHKFITLSAVFLTFILYRLMSTEPPWAWTCTYGCLQPQSGTITHSMNLSMQSRCVRHICSLNHVCTLQTEVPTVIQTWANAERWPPAKQAAWANRSEA